MKPPQVQRELWAAVGKSDAPAVQELVAAGADPNLPIASAGGDTPLIRAISLGDLSMVQALLTAGADVNLPIRQARSWTPLMVAHDKPQILSALVSVGADLEARTSADSIKDSSGCWIKRPGGETALHLAAAAGCAEAVHILLRAGAQVEARADNGRAPLDYALRQGAPNDIAEALVQAGAQLTPERLAAMHAAAHSPDSDLIAFPFVDEITAENPVPGLEPASLRTSVPAAQPRETPAEFRCPACGALIYSRKPKMCGQCGALLPPELLLSDEQAQAIADQRAWARELAAKMAPSLGSATPTPTRHLQHSGPEVDTSLRADTLLRRVSCASEFRHRERPVFWLYVSGYATLFAICTLMPWKVGLMPPAALIFMLVAFAVLCARAWIYASPICPNCHQNITVCSAHHCHVCGEPLKGGRCAACGVDNSWIGFVTPRANSAGYCRWITFCPGCGARIESMILRWRMPGA